MPLFPVSAAIFLGAVFVSFILIGLLRGALPSTFLAAEVNQRSGHSHSARQIGGLGTIPAACFVFGMAAIWGEFQIHPWAALGLGMTVLWLVGFLDDRLPLGPWVKLGAQISAAVIVVYGRGPDTVFLPWLPEAAGDIVAVFVLLSFVNMVNFMDGMDLMTSAGAGTAIAFTGALSLLGGDLPAWLASLALFGGLIGFAGHNFPPAPVFLGDSGSLPLGLAAGFLALGAAGSIDGAIWIALLPFAYYIGDTGSTVARRLLERKNLLSAHSEHAYQHARRGGIGSLKIALGVGLTGIVTGSAAILAATTGPAVSTLVTLMGWLAAGALIILLRMASRER